MSHFPFCLGIPDFFCFFCQYDNPEKPVLMYINSPGTTTEQGLPVGFETEAFAIADTMNYVSPPVHTLCVGKAYGLAAMLLACGHKGQRLGVMSWKVRGHPRVCHVSQKSPAGSFGTLCRRILQPCVT